MRPQPPWSRRSLAWSPWLALGALVLTGACVPEGKYESEVARADAEQARRQKLEQEAAALSGQLTEARTRLDQLEAELSSVRYKAEIAERERKDAEERVAQLREELERVGEHIRHFAERSQKLEGVHAELTELERDIAHRLSVFKELSVELGRLRPASGVALATMDGFPAVRFAAGSAVSARGLNSEAKRAVKVLVSVIENRGTSELIVLFSQGDEPGRSVAEAIAGAVGSKLDGARIEVLEGQGVDPGTAVALVRRNSAGLRERSLVSGQEP